MMPLKSVHTHALCATPAETTYSSKPSFLSAAFFLLISTPGGRAFL